MHFSFFTVALCCSGYSTDCSHYILYHWLTFKSCWSCFVILGFDKLLKRKIVTDIWSRSGGSCFYIFSWTSRSSDFLTSTTSQLRNENMSLVEWNIWSLITSEPRTSPIQTNKHTQTAKLCTTSLHWLGVWSAQHMSPFIKPSSGKSEKLQMWVSVWEKHSGVRFSQPTNLAQTKP